MGKVALVTGGAQRLGGALALALAQESWDLAVHYHTAREEALALQKQIRALGRRCEIFPGDLSMPQAPQALWEEVRQVFPRVNLLVTCASEYAKATWDSADLEDLEAAHRLEAWAPLVLARCLAAQGGNPVQGVFLLDTRYKTRDPGHFAYHMAKRQLFSYFRNLALETAPGLRLNAIAPGLVLKPESMPQEAWEALKISNPLGTLGSVEDLIRTLLFLVDSPFITGQVIYLDGGRHLLGGLYDA